MSIDTAMVLAAGLGTRMAPLTDTRPKPLIEVAGRALVDHALDRLAHESVTRAVVNVHYYAKMLETHLASRDRPSIVISNERDALLETGGGVAKALLNFGNAPFYLMNSDSIWWEQNQSALGRLSRHFDPQKMGGLLLLADIGHSVGYDGNGDFMLTSDGRLVRATGNQTGKIYTGTAILHPRLFDDCPAGAFSLNVLFDRAVEDGRLYGLEHEGEWMHVGTPAAIELAENRLRALGAEGLGQV